MVTITTIDSLISENGGATTATVTRTNTAGDLVVTLSSTDTTEATVPAQVTILNGDTTATFAVTAADDAALDGTQTVTITAASAGNPDATADILVADDELDYDEAVDGDLSDDFLNPTVFDVDVGAFSIFAAQQGSAFPGGRDVDYVTINLDDGEFIENLILTDYDPGPLNPGNAAFFSVASGAAFPIDFSATNISSTIGGLLYNETLHEGQDIIAASAGQFGSTGFTGFLGGAPGAESFSFWFNQTDLPSSGIFTFNIGAPALTVALSASSVEEDGAVVSGTVSRTGTTGDLTVTLGSADVGEATVPASVTILDGDTSASFDVTPIDDALADGDQVVDITASAAGLLDGSDTLTVTDIDVPTLTLSIFGSGVEETGGGAFAEVTRNTEDTASAVTVTLTSLDTTELAVQPTIEIPAGASTSDRFFVVAVSDNLPDGTQVATVEASAAGFVTGSASIDVIDDEQTFQDPLPPVVSDIEVSFELFATVPASDATAPLARVQQVIQVPGLTDTYVALDTRGAVTLIENGVPTTELIDVSTAGLGYVERPFGESGLRSIAFHPEFAQTGAAGYGKLYMAYSADVSSAPATTKLFSQALTQVDFHDVLSEFTVADPNNPIIDPATERELLRIEQPFLNHNFGSIQFNPDATPTDADYGLLYATVGDGGAGDDPLGAGQDLGQLLGSMFRIDPLGGSGMEAYGIPADNPFVATSGALPEIYAYGLRNPQLFSFDNGMIFAGEIGQNVIEEINVILPGENYGWAEREGTFEFTSGAVQNLPVDDATFGFQYPLTQFDHQETGFRGAVAGGFVYRGTDIPQLTGTYVFNELVSGRIFYIPLTDLSAILADGLIDATETLTPKEISLVDDLGVPTSFFETDGNVAFNRVDIRLNETNDGEIFAFSKQTGNIYTLAAAPAETVSLYADSTLTTLIDTYVTVNQAIAAAAAGNAIEVTDPAALGDIGATLVDVDDITIVANQPFDASFDLAAPATTFTLTGSTHASITGTASADTITASAGSNDLAGQGGDDSLEGGALNDTITGGTGADTLKGGPGDDDLSGEEDGDRILGDGGNDTLSGGAGDDFLIGNDGTDMLDGGTGADTLNGGRGDDTILGGDENDVVTGARGRDSIDGGTGDDTLLGKAQEDTVNGGNGHDRIDGGAAADSLTGGAGMDTLMGGAFNDVLIGDADADDLKGGYGRDTLDGGAGADVLNGGVGADSLTGGGEIDKFVFGANWGKDRIADFEATAEVMDLSATGLTFGDLTITQSGSDVLIRQTALPRNAITLENQLLSDISEVDFFFMI